MQPICGQGVHVLSSGHMIVVKTAVDNNIIQDLNFSWLMIYTFQKLNLLLLFFHLYLDSKDMNLLSWEELMGIEKELKFLHNC